MTIQSYIIQRCLLPLLLLCALSGTGQPDFNNRVQVSNGMIFYNDVKQPNVYYYLPGQLEIGQSSDGKPDLSFILMRYEGTFTTSDETERARFRNILTMRLLMKPVAADSLRQARQELQQERSGVVLLKPLPVSQIEAMVVFTPIGAPDTARQVKRGELAVESNNGYSTSATYWQERYFTLFLDNNSATLLLQAFQQNLSAISFTYAFYSKGKTEKKMLAISGSPLVDSSLYQQLTNVVADSTDSSGIRECLVKSDAFVISMDTAKYPGLIKMIDINRDVPPGYAMLNVRNYDFANNLRTDLYEKTVDLEATGAGGMPVKLSVSFHARDRDLTSINMRFKYAVRLDSPYRYRVRELLHDGREIISDWTTVSTWSNMLDVTSRPQPALQ